MRLVRDPFGGEEKVHDDNIINQVVVGVRAGERVIESSCEIVS